MTGDDYTPCPVCGAKPLDPHERSGDAIETFRCPAGHVVGWRDFLLALPVPDATPEYRP